jgi:hypothetical protein
MLHVYPSHEACHGLPANRSVQLPIRPDMSYVNDLSAQPRSTGSETTTYCVYLSKVDTPTPSVYGQRNRDNNYTIDGVPNNQVSYNGIPMYPPPETIAEMKVDSGADSGAYGWAPGATITLVTKSGNQPLSCGRLGIPPKQCSECQELLPA